MASGSSQWNRRAGVVINYTCLLFIMILFLIGTYRAWSVPVYVGIGTAILVVAIGFGRLHVRTGLWRLVHANVEKLDEREVQLTREALRYAYSIFAIITLLVLLVLALVAECHDSTLILIFIGLLYLAHTLPSAVIAWTQKSI